MTQRKRARILGVPETASKRRHNQQRRSTSTSDVEHTLGAAQTGRAPPPSTQYEIDRDAGFAHLENPDADDQRATQRLLARSELLGENHASLNAIIESVTMVNFMCHERLHVTLGPLINFIVGENGSGKSAILTAITLCLGGKASTTNRGGSLKSFIKEGREHASLIINIKNQGQDAYQPDLYGETIIVERNFTKSGSSGFKLKNSSGRIISTKKTEVEELIEYFQMQIDNPMTVLSQDNARQFLNQSSSSDKYKFFVKGVQLEQLDNDYKLVHETAEAMAVKLEVNQARIKKLEENVKTAQAKVELVKRHSGMRYKLKAFSKQMSWAQVEEQEKELEGRDRVVREAQLNVEELEREVLAKDQKYQQTNEAFECATEITRQLVDDMTLLREAESEAKDAHAAANQEMQYLHTEQRNIRGHLENAKKGAEDAQRKVDAELQRLQDANGGAHAKKLADLDAARLIAAEAKARLDGSIAEAPGLADATQAALEKLQNAGRPIEEKNQEISACENRLQGLRRDVGSSMAGFDRNMPKLLNAIRDEPRFKEKPVGPIGLHIKLLKPVWSSVLERYLGPLLNSFVVTSKQDQVLLSDMINHFKIPYCDVVIGNHHSVDTRGHEPDENYDSILRVLDIDNDLIKRQLIINRGIEQTILVEKRQDAMRIMYEGARPQNVKQCFCLHDHQRGWGLSLTYTPGSTDPASSSIRPLGAKPRMKTDADSQISYQQETLEHLRNELRTLQLRQRELQQSAHRQKQMYTHHTRTEKQLKENLERAEDRAEKLQDEVDGFNVEAGYLDGLQQNLQDAKAELAQHGGSYGEAGVAKEKQSDICLTRKRALDDVRLRIADLEAKIKKAENKAKRIQQARQITLQEKNLAIEAVNEARFVKEAADQKRDRQIARVESFTRDASQVCARVPVDENETAATLDAKILKLTEALKEYNRRAGGTDEEINGRYEAALQAQQDAITHFEGLQTLYNLLKRTYAERLDKWRKFQRYISARSRTNFTYLLSERGFRGRIFFDHEHKLLDLQVEPDLTLASAEGRQTKTLSGGEKSFSSVCLLLSVWEAMGAPLRCLDEYDVFMDNVNRDVTTKMIVRLAFLQLYCKILTRQ